VHQSRADRAYAGTHRRVVPNLTPLLKDQLDEWKKENDERVQVKSHKRTAPGRARNRVLAELWTSDEEDEEEEEDSSPHRTKPASKKSGAVGAKERKRPSSPDAANTPAA
jgi:hypothetical protein